MRRASLIVPERELIPETRRILEAVARTCGLASIEITADGSSSSEDFSERTPGKAESSFRVLLARHEDGTGVLRFSGSSLLPELVRGRVLSLRGRVGRPAPVLGSGEVLAEYDGVPVWTTRSEHGFRRDECIQLDPWLRGDARLFEHLKGESFFKLVPLIEFLRSLGDWSSWTKPRLRACFMFDDPNLHATRYGFLDFAQLAARANQHNYHVAFATIPLDHWYVSRKATRIFLDNRKFLSLLTHGNNHAFRELAVIAESSNIRAVVAQAMERVCRLETRTQLEVDRVIAPPHGAFALQTFHAAAVVGFHGACLSWGSIWSSNRDALWTHGLGGDPGVLVGSLGVIPRFRLDPDRYAQLLLAAYLQQPIVPVGHHWDVADGLEILSDQAAFVNSFGPVVWQGVGSMLWANYWSQVKGDEMRVQLFSPVAEIEVPPEVRQLVISLVSCDGLGLYGGKVTFANGEWELLETEPGGRFHVPLTSRAGGSFFRIRVRVFAKSDRQCFGMPPVNGLVKAVGRRIITEVRDRLMPYGRSLHIWHEYR